jgi:hypothetical protein
LLLLLLVRLGSKSVLCFTTFHNTSQHNNMVIFLTNHNPLCCIAYKWKNYFVWNWCKYGFKYGSCKHTRIYKVAIRNVLAEVVTVVVDDNTPKYSLTL